MAARKKKVKYSSRASLPYLVCTVSVCPVRKKPSDTAEIVTQLLFGECGVVLLKKHNNWMKIRCCYDNYEGWIDSKQIVRISESEKDNYTNSPSYCLDLVQSVSGKHETFPIVLGSSLPQFDGLHCNIHDERYLFNGLAIDPERFEDISEDLVDRLARKYLHAPYLWGGKSPFGIDCSGFTQIIFKMLGIFLPRDASQQVQHGEIVDFHGGSRVGDLAFFENSDGKIIHVGIILSENRIIHASGRVRIDEIDHHGIYNRDLKKYTHVHRVTKRYFELNSNREVMEELSIPKV